MPVARFGFRCTSSAAAAPECYALARARRRLVPDLHNTTRPPQTKLNNKATSLDAIKARLGARFDQAPLEEGSSAYVRPFSIAYELDGARSLVAVVYF